MRGYFVIVKVSNYAERIIAMKHQTISLREGRTDVTLTTYILEDSPEMLNGNHRPAVIICPGGAYLSCSDREGEPIAMAFANMGYHAFVLRYGVYMEGVPGMFIPEPGAEVPIKEHCIHPNPMRDIARAMLEIRAHADEWLVDTDRIAICGFSAGAHNCAMYATNWHKPVISEFFGKSTDQFRPAACILGYTLSDYVFMKENAAAATDPIAAGLFAVSNTAFLGTPMPENALLEEVSPARNVTENCPPVFLWATSEDSLVPVQHTLLIAKALADKKIPFEVHVFENGPHGLATSTQSTAALSNILPEVATWIPMCDTWLKKRFALDMPALTIWERMMAEGAGK